MEDIEDFCFLGPRGRILLLSLSSGHREEQFFFCFCWGGVDNSRRRCRVTASCATHLSSLEGLDECAIFNNFGAVG